MLKSRDFVFVSCITITPLSHRSPEGALQSRFPCMQLAQVNSYTFLCVSLVEKSHTHII